MKFVYSFLLLAGLSAIAGDKMLQEAPAAHAPAAHASSWSKRRSLYVLLGATAGIARLSELLVGAVEPVAEKAGISEFFLGIILIPIVLTFVPIRRGVIPNETA